MRESFVKGLLFIAYLYEVLVKWIGHEYSSNFGLLAGVKSFQNYSLLQLDPIITTERERVTM